MPCRTDDYFPPSLVRSPVAAHIYDELKAQADLATRLLCAVAAKMTAKQIAAIPELKEWVDEHAEIDRQRRAKEQAELQAQLKKVEENLEKLKNERAALIKRALIDGK